MEKLQKIPLEYLLKQNLECGKLMPKAVQILTLIEIEITAIAIEGLVIAVEDSEQIPGVG